MRKGEAYKLIQQSSDGRISFLVSRVDYRIAMQVNRHRTTAFEDIETDVSDTNLIANDGLGEFSCSKLKLTTGRNFRQGTGHLDANGYVHSNPAANYSGTDVGFDKGVRDIVSQSNDYKSYLRAHLLGYRARIYLITTSEHFEETCTSIRDLASAAANDLVMKDAA